MQWEERCGGDIVVSQLCCCALPCQLYAITTLRPFGAFALHKGALALCLEALSPEAKSLERHRKIRGGKKIHRNLVARSFKETLHAKSSWRKKIATKKIWKSWPSGGRPCLTGFLRGTRDAHLRELHKIFGVLGNFFDWTGCPCSVL